MLGEFFLVECQFEIDARTQRGAPLGRRNLHVDAGVFLVQQVDAFVEVDLADIKPQLPQTALGLLERESHQPRHDR